MILYSRKIVVCTINYCFFKLKSFQYIFGAGGRGPGRGAEAKHLCFVASKNKVKGYLINLKENRTRAQMLVKTLQRHRIEAYDLKKSMTVKGKRFAKGELLSGNISPTDATKRRNKNRAPEESIQEKQSILRQKSNHGNSLSLQYKISQHLLQSSIARQNEILENLAKDPNFMKTFGETLNYKLIEK